MTLDTILCDVTAWQRGQFPHATPASIAKHLLEEAQELQHAPSDRMEIADVQILLAGLAAWQGIDLAEAVAEKLAINQARVWGKPDEHGVVKHVEVDDGFAEFEAFWPAMPDLQGGADLFAEHPVVGGPEPEPITPEVNIQSAPTLIAPLPERTFAQIVADLPKPINANGHHADELPELSTATVVTVGAAHTGGNGHHAEPSPAAVATLGPEHTVVTPLVPRRPRTLAEVDGIEDDETDSRPTRAKLPVVTREQLIAELRRQAMAGAMPTRPAFDLAKPAVWPMSQMLLKRFETTWANLADEAGLRLGRS